MKPEVVAPFHKREGTGGGMDVLSHQVSVVQRRVAMPSADDAEEHQQYAGDDERQAEASQDIIEGKGHYGNQAACHALPALAVYLANLGLHGLLQEVAVDDALLFQFFLEQVYLGTHFF